MARSALGMNPMMMNPLLMQQMQQMQQQLFQQQQSAFPAQFPAAPRATLGVASSPLTTTSTLTARGMPIGVPALEKMRLAQFSAIKKLSYNGADPTLTLNANGNPLPNTCARGFSEPIWEGFQITESYCRCPGDDSYGFTCQEGFGNPCANNDQQFFNADSRIPNNYFVHCSNYLPYLKKCPAGLVWDQSLTTCNWPAAQGPSVGGAAYGQAAAPLPAAAPYSAPAPAAAPSYAAPAPAAAPAYSAPAPAAAPAYSAPAASSGYSAGGNAGFFG